MLRTSLRAKIMICCIGLVALLDLLVVLFVRRELSETLRAEYMAKGRNMAINLAARSEHFVLTEDFVSMLQLVKDLKESEEDIAYAYVADRKGTVLTHTFDGGFPEGLRGLNTPESGDPWRHEMFDSVEKGLIHDISVPLHEGKVGSVHVGISEDRIGHTISRFTSALITIAGFVLLVAIGLAAVVAWVVTQPVHSLIRAARRIRDGELGHKVTAQTKDEIGELAQSFSQMSEELLKQHKILEERNRRIRTAREQAAWERDKLRAIIDSMVEGLIFVDSEERISLCNESAERAWGVTASEIVGKLVQECEPCELCVALRRVLEQAGQKPDVGGTDSLKLSTKHCLISYSNVHGEGGRYLGLVFLNLDISDRVELEQEQKRLRDQLFQQEKMALIGQIAASVAHELNTPLGTILLRTQLVRSQMPGNGSADLAVVESEAQRCRRIIDSLLGFSRRSEGTVTRIDLRSLIRESLSLIENDLKLKGISLRTDFASDGMTVSVDGNQIQQVLLNLISNAADAMPDGGHLEICTRADNHCMEIQITDDGYPNGMVLEADDKPLFRIEGPLTASASTYCMVESLPQLTNCGVETVRILPHWSHTGRIVEIYRDVLEHRSSAGDALEELAMLAPEGLCNGWLFGKAGWSYESTPVSVL